MAEFIALAGRFARDEEGATMIEYGLMLVLIAAVCFAAVALIGNATVPMFNGVAGYL